MNDRDATRRLLQSTDFWQIWKSNDVEDRGSKGQKRSSGAGKTSKGAMKSYSVCWDQAIENCGQVWKVGKIGVRSQLWEELCERKESSKKGELLKKEGRSNSNWEKPSETIGKEGGWCSKVKNRLLEERKKYWEDGELSYNPLFDLELVSR